MTGQPEELNSERPKAQFSLASMMLFVTLVGLYFGMVRLISLNFLFENRFFLLGVFLLTCFIFVLYSIWIGESMFSFACFVCSGVLIIVHNVFGLGESAISKYFIFGTPFLMTFAAINTIIRCKKQTGSFLPWKKRAEGESDG